MMEITLVNIYSTETSCKYLMSSYLLKAYTNKVFSNRKDIHVTVLNYGTNVTAKEIADGIYKSNPYIVGFSCYIWNINLITEILQLISTRNYIRILGGPEISESFLSNTENIKIADYFIIGEGEKKFADLLYYIESNGSPDDLIKGIATWDKKNHTLIYKKSDECFDINEVPSIYLTDTIDDINVFTGQIYIETQRGCSQKCKFCLYHKNRDRICYHSLQKIKDELLYLIKEKKVQSLRIIDANFLSNSVRSHEIIDYLISIKEKGIRIPTIYLEYIYTYANKDYIEKCSKLKNKDSIFNLGDINSSNRVQVYSVQSLHYNIINCIGIQSFNQQSLRSINRPSIDLSKFQYFMKNIKTYNLLLKIDLIVGLPYETIDSFYEGLEILLPLIKNTDHILNMHILQILPQTELEKDCAKYNINYSQIAPHYIISTNSMSKNDLVYLSKRIAILYRIINSPLRIDLFNYIEKTNKNIREVLDDLINEINNSKIINNTVFLNDSIMTDEYFDSLIFKDIPYNWLNEVLQKVN